jgi:YD repeat-containing protein
MTRVETKRGATVLQNIAFARAATGRISGITATRAEDGWTYGYDLLDRLTSATNTGTASLTQTFAYDAAHNMTSNSAVWRARGGRGAAACDADRRSVHVFV